MGARGRRSQASLSVVTSIEIKRPEPDPTLSEEAAEIWREVCEYQDPEWFKPDNFPVLAQYCRHIVSARHVDQLIAVVEKENPVDILKLDRLYKMQERETRAILSAATKMRITHQSTYDRRRKIGLPVKPPWD